MDESMSKMDEEISKIDEGMSHKDEPISKSKSKGSESAQNWHDRLGDASKIQLAHLVLPNNIAFCVGCHKGKMHFHQHGSRV